MRASLAALAIAAAAAGTVGVAIAQGPGEDIVEEPAAWQLRGVSADGRTLELLYEAGGCSREDGRAVVEETASTVRVEVLHTAPGEVCTADSQPLPVGARLAEPIDGRRVEGQNTDHLIRATGGRVPRVAGLSPGDAVDLLGRRGFHVRTRGAHTEGKVAVQRPRAGGRLRARRTVTLSLVPARR